MGSDIMLCSIDFFDATWFIAIITADVYGFNSSGLTVFDVVNEFSS
jgi:hypothetical protein